MSRVLFAVLLLCNLLLFAQGAGYLGPQGSSGEPERLAAQINPAAVRVLAEPLPLAPPPAEPPGAAEAPAGPLPATGEPGPQAGNATAVPPAAPEPPQACLLVQGLNEVQAEEVRRAVGALAGEWRSKTSQEESISSWWVHLPPSGGRDGAERRVAEVRRQGVSDYFIVQEAGPNLHAVSLGLYKNEAAAQQLATQLRAKGVKGVAVAARSAVIHQVEVRGPADRLPEVVAELAARYRGTSRPCVQP